MSKVTERAGGQQQQEMKVSCRSLLRSAKIRSSRMKLKPWLIHAFGLRFYVLSARKYLLRFGYSRGEDRGRQAILVSGTCIARNTRRFRAISGIFRLARESAPLQQGSKMIIHFI